MSEKWGPPVPSQPQDWGEHYLDPVASQELNNAR
jgi:hypothetical protein